MAPELGHLLDSLGWALLHSLWQGALAAIAVVAFRNLTSEKNAALRYGVQVAALVACLIALLATLMIYLSKGHTIETSLIAGSPVEHFTARLSTSGHPLAGDASNGVSANLTVYTPLLAILWCIGFAILAIRYCGAFIVTQRLRYIGISHPSGDWIKRFDTLVQNTGIRHEVKLFISDRISGPLTLGFFKPVVLVPAGFFAGLPTAQIEAILLHEIAHIRRHDYLINLLQTAIRTIFFFHPAVHYISRKIDHDREHACDDFAVALTKDPRSLAKGLAALRLNLTPDTFALAADNGNTPLVARLKRLGSPSEAPRRPEHVLTSVAALIVAAGLYVTASPLANADPTQTVRETKPVSSLAHPSGYKGSYRFEQVTENGKSFTVKLAEDGTRWVLINGVWYDVDHHPDMIAEIPDAPVAPTPPSPPQDDAFSKILNGQYGQYKVDLDYYIASLKHARLDTSELAGAAPETKSQNIAGKLEKAEKTRDKIENLVDEAIERSRREKEQIWKDAKNKSQSALEPGLYIDGEYFEGPESRAWIKQFEKEMTAIAEAQARGLMSAGAAEDARDQAQEAFDARIERAEEQHERAMEARVRAEEARIRAEEARIRAEEQHIRHEEQRERALEHAERERERAEATVERAMEQAERERERVERERERAEKVRERNIDYQNFSQAVMDQLKKDGLIDAAATSVTITYPDKKMTVNGRRVPRDMEGNYCGYLETYGIKKYDGTKIQIKPQSFEYKSHNQDGMNTRHIHQDFGHRKEASNRSLTFSHPTSGSWVSQSFHKTNLAGKRHNGIDLAAPARTPILASASGLVTHAEPKGKWGNLITISHNGGYETRYAHLGEICVAEGDHVSQGDNIGTIGSTGVSSGPHLHFEIRHNGENLIPEIPIQGT